MSDEFDELLSISRQATSSVLNAAATGAAIGVVVSLLLAMA